MKNKIKSGDILLVQNSFNIKDYTTWLIPLIHLGQNVENLFGLTGKFFPYHHVLIAAEKISVDDKTGFISNRELHFFEAHKTTTFRNSDYINKYKKIVILRPTFLTEEEKNMTYYICNSLKNIKYDIRGVLIDQFIRYFSELIIQIITFGNGKGSCLKVHRNYNIAKKRVYCSEIVLEIYNKILKFDLFEPHHYSPRDLYKLSKRGLFKKIKLK